MIKKILPWILTGALLSTTPSVANTTVSLEEKIALDEKPTTPKKTGTTTNNYTQQGKEIYNANPTNPKHQRQAYNKFKKGLEENPNDIEAKEGIIRTTFDYEEAMTHLPAVLQAHSQDTAQLVLYLERLFTNKELIQDHLTTERILPFYNQLHSIYANTDNKKTAIQLADYIIETKGFVEDAYINKAAIVPQKSTKNLIYRHLLEQSSSNKAKEAAATFYMSENNMKRFLTKKERTAFKKTNFYQSKQ